MDPELFITFLPPGNSGSRVGSPSRWWPREPRSAPTASSIKELATRYSAVLVPLIGVLAWFGLSALWAGNAASAISEWLKVLISAAVFLLVLLGVRDVDQVRRLALAFVAAGTFSALLGLMGVSSGPSNPDAAREVAAEGRITAWAGIPTCWPRAWWPRRDRARPGGTARPSARRPVLIGCALLAILGTAATQSRGGILAGSVALVAGLIVFRRQSARVVPRSWFASSSSGTTSWSTPMPANG